MAAYQLIIDGYNLLHAAGLAKKHYAPGQLEDARENLLSGLRRMLAVREQEQTLIVFDARKRDPSLSDDMLRSGKIRILFSTQHANADALIETLIEDHPTPRKLTVVSSDHRIQRSARLHQALFLDSESFIADLMRRPRKTHRPLPPHPKQTGEMSPKELEYWMSQFGALDLPVGAESPFTEPSLPPSKSSQPTEKSASRPSKSPLPHKSRASRPKFKAPGKGERRPLSETGTEPAIFSPEWIAELQAWVIDQERRRR